MLASIAFPPLLAAPAKILIALAVGLAVEASPALAAPTADGDFDGDGRSDLAIGAPADSVNGVPGAGAVNVLYGARDGLTEVGDEQFTKLPQRIAGAPQPDARFGAALAAGDLDDDGFADLAIGAPGEDVGALRDAPASGAVTVLYGSAGGLVTRPAAGSWTQNGIGIKGGAEQGDRFGAALAIGDFDDDGRGDLAIGVPGEGVGAAANAGAVNVLYGRTSGLHEAGDQLWTQNTRGIKGLAGAGHRFGAALAAGDLSRNARAELAIGIPGGAISGQGEAGAVSVLYGRSTGLSSTDDLWSQDARGIKGVAASGEGFGSALAIGDFDGDRSGDLAIGIPRDDVGNATGAGAVSVLYGTGIGLREEGDQRWTQESPGIRSRASIGETFGASLAAADFSRNGADDLAIGVPRQGVSGHLNAGAVSVLYGRRGEGLRAVSNHLWTQDAAGIKGRAERDDRLGDALATGDFDGDGAFDLAIGVPGDGVAGFASAGAANVLYGTAAGLSEHDDGLWTQATSGIKGAVGDDRLGSALASGTAADD